MVLGVLLVSAGFSRPATAQQQQPRFQRPCWMHQPRRCLEQRLAVRAAGAGAAEAVATTCTVHFVQAGVCIDCAPGTNIYEAAQQAGIDTITVGCCQGNCGVCEVEVTKGEGGEPVVVRSCIVAVPPGYASIAVNEMYDDAVWGVDGYDT